jgi:hypothetical protein
LDGRGIPSGVRTEPSFSGRLAQDWVEVAYTELDQDRLHPIDRAGPLFD